MPEVKQSVGFCCVFECNRGRKKTTDTLVQVFSPVSKQEENHYSEKKGDVLTEANKVNRQLMLFPNT